MAETTEMNLTFDEDDNDEESIGESVEDEFDEIWLLIYIRFIKKNTRPTI